MIVQSVDYCDEAIKYKRLVVDGTLQSNNPATAGETISQSNIPTKTMKSLYDYFTKAHFKSITDVTTVLKDKLQDTTKPCFELSDHAEPLYEQNSS